MIDLVASLCLVAITGTSATAYLVRAASRGRVRSERVEAEGESVLVGKGVMEMFYWAIAPASALCARAGITGNAVSYASLATGLAASLALGAGRFGVAAVLTAASFAGDALDGAVARARGEASPAGEVLDATIDRYVELAFLAGLAFHFRMRPALLVLALAAIAGAFMVSYSTAKAEALRVTPPRGSMRRAERAVFLLLGVTLTAILRGIPAAAAWSDAPIAVALALVAVVGNVSAVRRLSAIARALRSPS